MNNDLLIIELYRSLMENIAFSDYLSQRGYKVKIFSFFKQEKKRFINKKSYMLREAACFIKLLFNIFKFRNKKVYCLGGFYAILFMYKMFGLFLGENFRLYIFNFYIHRTGEKKIVKRILRFLLKNKRCILIVQSPGEVDYYQSLTSIPVHFVPYCANLIKIKPGGSIVLPEMEYVFTGGYTNRDYLGVLQCAARMPDTKFVLAVSLLNMDFKSLETPSNIIVYKDIIRDDFEYLLAKATVVLIPLMSDVGASGQMLCLSAMQNKKAIVYSNVSVVNYYLANDAGIPYQMGNVDSMEKGLKSLLSDEKLREITGCNAFKNYENNYTVEHQNRQLFNIVDRNFN